MRRVRNYAAANPMTAATVYFIGTLAIGIPILIWIDQPTAPQAAWDGARVVWYACRAWAR